MKCIRGSMEWLVCALLIASCGGRVNSSSSVDASAPSDMIVSAPLPDSRFKWVGAFSSYDYLGVTDAPIGFTSSYADNHSWSPLNIGDADLSPGLLDGGSHQTLNLLPRRFFHPLPQSTTSRAL